MAQRRWWISALVLVLTAGATGVLARQAPPIALEVAVFSRSVQPGEVVRIDVTCDCGAVPPRAVALGTDIPLVAAGDRQWRGLLGIDLDLAPGTYPLVVSVPGAERTRELRIASKSFPTRQLRVAPRYVDPPAAEVPRILREAATLTALFTGAGIRDWAGPFAVPVAHRVNSNFGARSVFNGESRSPHAGVDFATPTGQPVAAPAAARVVLAEDLYFTGLTVVLDHGAGVFSLLAHLSALTVTAGDDVERGAIVGRSGATGRVTGPHLHWTVRVNNARVDPLSLIAATAP